MSGINDKVKAKGCIGLLIVNKDGSIAYKDTFENFVSSAYKVNLLANSVSLANQIPTGTPYGMLVSDLMYRECDSSGYLNYEGTDRIETCYALNLSNDLVMTSATKFVNFYESNGALGDKIIAFANTKRTTAEPKEGIIDFCDAVAMLDMQAATEVYKWDLEQGNGTFNWIVKAPGVKGNLYRGFVNYKGIDKVNLFDSSAALSTKYIIPGAGNITNNYEVLLEYTVGSNTRWIYNIQTGETRVADGIAASVTIPDDIVHEVVIGDYLYILRASKTLYTINTTTGSVVGSTAPWNGTLGYTKQQSSIIGFFVDSVGDLYVSDVYSNQATVRKVTLGTASVGSPINISSYSGIGGLPSGWNLGYVGIMSDSEHERYFVTEHTKGTIICTDLSNVTGTMIGTLDTDVRRGPYYNEDIGYKYFRVGTGQRYPTYYVYNNTSRISLPYYYAGIFLSDDDFANYISAYKLDTPKTKTNEQVMYIAYGYKFI